MKLAFSVMSTGFPMIGGNNNDQEDNKKNTLNATR